jgi:thiol-disulfide isomerase/thioredoxin
MLHFYSLAPGVSLSKGFGMLRSLLKLYCSAALFLAFTPLIAHDRRDHVHDFHKLAHARGMISSEYWSHLMLSSKPAVIRLTSIDCHRCNNTNRMFHDLAHRFAHTVTFIDMNYKDFAHLVKRHHIRSLPTFLFLKQGSLHVLHYQEKITTKAIVKAMREHFGVNNF